MIRLPTCSTRTYTPFPYTTLFRSRGDPPSGRSSGVERNLAKVGVEGSNPFARSRFSTIFVEPARLVSSPPCRSARRFEFLRPCQISQKSARPRHVARNGARFGGDVGTRRVAGIQERGGLDRVECAARGDVTAGGIDPDLRILMAGPAHPLGERDNDLPRFPSPGGAAQPPGRQGRKRHAPADGAGAAAHPPAPTTGGRG